jgi:hypothetical protein
LLPLEIAEFKNSKTSVLSNSFLTFAAWETMEEMPL